MTTIIRKEYDAEGTQTLLGLPYKEITELWDGSITTDTVTIEDAYNIDEIDITDNAKSTGLVSLVAKITEVQRQKRILSASATDISISGFALDAEGNVDWDTDKTDSLTEVESLKGQTIGGVKILGAYKTDGSTNYSNCNIDFKTNQDNGNAVFTIVPQEYLSQLTALLPSGSSFATTSCSVYAEGGYFNEVEDTTKTNVYCLAAFNSKNYSLGCYLVSISCGIDGGVPSWMATWHSKFGLTFAQCVALSSNGKASVLKTIESLDTDNFNLMATTDGKVFVRICHHYVNSGANMFTSSNAGYNLNNANLYSILSKIGDIGMLDSKYEFYVEQYNTTSTTTPQICQWTQTSNPYTSTSISGFVNIKNMVYGLAKTTGTTIISWKDSSNWWCATGCYTTYNDGIPGYPSATGQGEGQICKGTLNVYLRVL